MDDEFDLEDEEMGDVEEEEEGEDASEPDSAFASSEGDGDEDMVPESLADADDEDVDGGITTNMEDDLENEGYTLPVVDAGGEQEEHEHGTSLREVEARLRWLVGVCMGKGEKVNGVPGK